LHFCAYKRLEVDISLSSIWFDQITQERQPSLSRKQYLPTNPIKSMGYSITCDKPNSQALINFDCQKRLQKSDSLHRDTSRKMREFSIPPGYQRKHPPHKPKLAPVAGISDVILESDENKPREQRRHTAKRIFSCGTGFKIPVVKAAPDTRAIIYLASSGGISPSQSPTEIFPLNTG
jgi:hypothetical protein